MPKAQAGWESPGEIRMFSKAAAAVVCGCRFSLCVWDFPERLPDNDVFYHSYAIVDENLSGMMTI